MAEMNWPALLSFEVSPQELVLRGTVMYWFLFLVLRFVMRRDVGAVSTADVLLIVLVADASQNAMAGHSNSIAEGVVLVSTLFGWNWLLDVASFRSRWVAKLTDPPPLLLIRNGRMVQANLRREHITVDELKAHLRESGVDSLSDVRAAFLEADGQFSVIRVEADTTRAPRTREPGS